MRGRSLFFAPIEATTPVGSRLTLQFPSRLLGAEWNLGRNRLNSSRYYRGARKVRAINCAKPDKLGTMLLKLDQRIRGDRPRGDGKRERDPYGASARSDPDYTSALSNSSCAGPWLRRPLMAAAAGLSFALVMVRLLSEGDLDITVLP
jgi:hypothetical protein